MQFISSFVNLIIDCQLSLSLLSLSTIWLFVWTNLMKCVFNIEWKRVRSALICYWCFNEAFVWEWRRLNIHWIFNKIGIQSNFSVFLLLWKHNDLRLPNIKFPGHTKKKYVAFPQSHQLSVRCQRKFIK